MTSFLTLRKTKVVHESKGNRTYKHLFSSKKYLPVIKIKVLTRNLMFLMVR